MNAYISLIPNPIKDVDISHQPSKVSSTASRSQWSFPSSCGYACAAVCVFTQPLGDSLCSLGDDREKNVCVIETAEFLFLVLISKQQYDIVKIICFSWFYKHPCYTGTELYSLWAATKNQCAVLLFEKPPKKEEYCVFLQLQRGILTFSFWMWLCWITVFELSYFS